MPFATAYILRSILIFISLLTIAFLGHPPLTSAEDPAVNERTQDNHQQTATAKAIDPRAMEVRFTDDSVLMLLLVDERIEIVTPHGTLQIPTAGIQRIQFAQRIPTEVQAKIAAAIENLGHADEAIAKTAEAELWELKDRSYRAVIVAENSTNEQLASRASALRKKLEKQLGEAIPTMHGDDIIELIDDRIVGKISAAVIKVKTSQFGELSMKLADVRNLRSQAIIQREPEEEAITILPDPGDLGNYAAMIGKKFHFRVTGASGSIYGTDVYTSDSELAPAAVHAGIVAIGQTGVVAVEIVTPPSSFASSTRNGITSSSWGTYSGAYKVLKDKGQKEKAAPQVQESFPRVIDDPFGAFER